MARRLFGRFFPWVQLAVLKLRRLRRRGGDDFEASFVRRHGRLVKRGPFAGLAFVDLAVGGPQALVPKLIGSYELEIQDAVEEAIEAGFTEAVNIGAGDGYYAVGLARRQVEAKVYAFEIDAEARRICEETAIANGVQDRLEIRSFCTPDALRSLELRRPFVVCDCESCELDVLLPKAVPSLREARLLVELHDFIDPEITDRIVERFARTHGVELIATQSRDPSDFPELNEMPARERQRAITEGRPGPMRWAVLTPRLEAAD